jgi:hypothetical protein
MIITGSEDGTVRIWHSTTYRLLLAFAYYVSLRSVNIPRYSTRAVYHFYILELIVCFFS